MTWPPIPRFSHDLFRRFPHQSGLVLPLVLDEQVAGAFYLVWWTARRQLTEREQELLASITAQVTVLLKNARRFEKAERERLHLGVMYDLARRMAAVQDADQLLSLLVEEAAGLLGAEAAGIRLLEGDELVLSARTAAAAERHDAAPHQGRREPDRSSRVDGPAAGRRGPRRGQAPGPRPHAARRRAWVSRVPRSAR